MAKITFTILGKKKVVNVLTFIKKTVKSLQPAFRDIAQNFREIERKTFADGGRPASWRPLSPKYATWKAKNFPGAPIMVQTGDLRKSLVSTGGDHIEIIKKDELIIGTQNPLGLWHQTGAGSLPVRKVISPTPRDLTEWINITRSFIIEKLGLKRSGF